jgi:hypothetical protein
MKVTIMRTRDWQDPGEEKCPICGERFYVGEVSLVAVSEDDIEIGEVCFACVHAGAEHIQEKLEKRARFAAPPRTRLRRSPPRVSLISRPRTSCS